MGRSRRERGHRDAQARRRRRWLIIGAAAAAAALAAWFVLPSVLSGRSAAEGATLASYKPPDVHALVVSASDDRTVTFGSHAGMLVSRDAGTTWRPLEGSSGKDAMGIATPPGSKIAYAAGHDVFLRSDDAGVTWRSLRPALPGTDIHGFAASAVRAGTFYAYVVGHGLYRSEDAGNVWQKAGSPPGSTMSLAVGKSGSTDTLLAATMEGASRSRDGGVTWERVSDLGGVQAFSAAGETVYAAAGNFVPVSVDGGTTWARRAFPRGAAVLVAVGPSDPNVVYVVTQRFEVWRSRDGGLTWERAG